MPEALGLAQGELQQRVFISRTGSSCLRHLNAAFNVLDGNVLLPEYIVCPAQIVDQDLGLGQRVLQHNCRLQCKFPQLSSLLVETEDMESHREIVTQCNDCLVPGLFVELAPVLEYRACERFSWRGGRQRRLGCSRQQSFKEFDGEQYREDEAYEEGHSERKDPTDEVPAGSRALIAPTLEDLKEEEANRKNQSPLAQIRKRLQELLPPRLHLAVPWRGSVCFRRQPSNPQQYDKRRTKKLGSRPKGGGLPGQAVAIQSGVRYRD